MMLTAPGVRAELGRRGALRGHCAARSALRCSFPPPRPAVLSAGFAAGRGQPEADPCAVPEPRAQSPERRAQSAELRLNSQSSARPRWPRPNPCPCRRNGQRALPAAPNGFGGGGDTCKGALGAAPIRDSLLQGRLRGF